MIASYPQSEPVGMAWAPDGRIFVWEKRGLVWILKDGALLSDPFLDLRGRVNSANDRGLLGFALDPDYAGNGYVYLFYAFEPDSNATGGSGPRVGRLSRVQTDPAQPNRALPGTETILLGKLDGPCTDHPAGSDCLAMDIDSHSAGSLVFAPDGNLFVTIGDGSSYLVPDPTSFRAQDLDRYQGKILRIKPDGRAPGDNPFDDGTQSIRSKVYAYGLRNPFRIGLDARGEPYIGDVGSNRFEEINRGRGANFGWPCWEGPEPNWFRVSSPGFEDCSKLDSTITKTEKPIFSYNRTLGTCIIGGDFNYGSRYPDSMHGDFFFADYMADKVFRLRMDSVGNVLGTDEFAAGIDGPVFMKFGPDGNLYYVAITSGGIGEIHRIRYSDPPNALRVTKRARGGNQPLGLRRVDGMGRVLSHRKSQDHFPGGALKGIAPTPIFQMK
jgi:glucose/arabinose dehydrogenase